MFENKKTTDIRLADFDVKEGDTLILEEWNPNTEKYTGRTLRKEIKNLNKVFLMDFHSDKEIKKHGHWVIELG